MPNPQSRSLAAHLTALLTLLLLQISGCAESTATPGVSALAIVGEPATGLPEDYNYEGFEPNYSMGAAGHTAFVASANIERGSNQQRVRAIWLGQKSELAPVVKEGQELPGTQLRLAQLTDEPMVVTASGYLGFTAATSAAPRGYRPRALLVYRNDRLRKVVANGDNVPLPDGDVPLLNISQFVMTDHGVLFMGDFGRRQTGIWYWNYSDTRLVMADRAEFAIGSYLCTIRSVAATSIDLNASGLAVFRVTLGGNECPRGGLVAWDAKTEKLIPVAMNRTAVFKGADLEYQSLTGDARVSDAGEIVMHANVYSHTTKGVKESTLFQSLAGRDARVVLDEDSAFADLPSLQLTHAILGDGLAAPSNGSLVHFVKNNRDRILVRTDLGEEGAHAVVAQTG